MPLLCSFCLEDGGGAENCTKVDHPQMIEFLSQEFKIDLVRRIPRSPQNPPVPATAQQPCISLCSRCSVKYQEICKLHNFLIYVNRDLLKLLNEVRNIILVSTERRNLKAQGVLLPKNCQVPLSQPQQEGIHLAKHHSISPLTPARADLDNLQRRPAEAEPSLKRQASNASKNDLIVPDFQELQVISVSADTEDNFQINHLDDHSYAKCQILVEDIDFTEVKTVRVCDADTDADASDVDSASATQQGDSYKNPDDRDEHMKEAPTQPEVATEDLKFIEEQSGSDDGVHDEGDALMEQEATEEFEFERDSEPEEQSTLDSRHGQIIKDENEDIELMGIHDDDLLDTNGKTTGVTNDYVVKTDPLRPSSPTTVQIGMATEGDRGDLNHSERIPDSNEIQIDSSFPVLQIVPQVFDLPNPNNHGYHGVVLTTLSEKRRRKMRIPDSEDVECECHLCDPCDVEPRPFRSIYLFKLHMEQNHSLAPLVYSCTKMGCDKSYAAEILLKKHVLFHEEESLKRFGCTDCEARFSERHWNRHIAWHEDVANRIVASKIYICKFCCGRFKSHLTLRQHEVRKHSKKLVYSCTCGVSYGSALLLEAHAKVHDSEGPYTCTLCNESKEYAKAKQLEDHLIEIHFASECVPSERKPKNTTKCDSCLKEIRTSQYAAHKCKKGPSATTCKICRRHFKSQSGLKTHICLPKGTGRKISLGFTCYLCPEKIYKQSTSLLHHLLKDHEEPSEKTLPCPECPKQFATTFFLERHIENHEFIAKGYLSCDVCEERFEPNDDLGLKNHEKRSFHSTYIYTPKQKHRCTVSNCDESFYRLTRLTECEPSGLHHHERECHPELFIHNCEICHRSYMDAVTLEIHMLVCMRKHGYADPTDANVETNDNDNDLEKFVCKYRLPSCDCDCDKKFTTQTKLLRHFVSHPINTLFTCQLCHQKSETRKEHATHLMTTHGVKYAPFKCNICGATFAARLCFRPHKKLHERRDEFLDSDSSKTCEFCGLRYPTVRGLQFHHARVHKDQLNVSLMCDTCGKTLKSLKTFRAHRRIHGGRIHGCYFCGKAFALNEQLQHHLNLKHTNERPYQCHICHICFAVPNHRVLHVNNVHKQDGTFIPWPKSKLNPWTNPIEIVHVEVKSEQESSEIQTMETGDD